MAASARARSSSSPSRRGRASILRGLAASVAGKLGREKVRGVHFEEADEITIEGDNSNVILDGEMFRAETRQPDQPETRAAPVIRQARGLSGAGAARLKKT